MFVNRRIATIFVARNTAASRIESRALRKSAAEASVTGVANTSQTDVFTPNQGKSQPQAARAHTCYHKLKQSSPADIASTLIPSENDRFLLRKFPSPADIATSPWAKDFKLGENRSTATNTRTRYLKLEESQASSFKPKNNA